MSAEAPAKPIDLNEQQGRAARLAAWLDAWAPRLLALAIVGYVLAFAALSGLKLAWLRQGFDMAGNEQAIWNTLHGRPFRTSVFAMMQYDFDDGPVLLQIPLALLYGLHQSPYTLLVLQSLALGLAAWPLYLIGAEILPRRWQALALAGIYLLHPTTQHINMYEFQLRSFMVPFALCALLFLRRGRLGWYALFLFLMMCTKTEAGFTLIAFGLYALLTRRPWRFAAVPLLIGPAWVAVALGVIVPRFSDGDFITKIYSYGALGNSVGDVIRTMLTDPLLTLRTITTPPKLSYLLKLFGLQGFLALFSPTLILALPVLMLNLISPNAVQFNLFYQYPALVYPFLLVAAAEGLRWLAEWLGRSPAARARLISGATCLLLLGALWANATMNNVALSLLNNREPAGRLADARAILALVPPDAAVAAGTFLAPHLAQRQEIYFFPGNNSYPPEYVDRAEYLVADRNPPSSRDKVLPALERYLADPRWELAAERGDFVLLRQRR
ncbi:MAG TPA: DUF2079 domain-containing protein [Herpetosiphonaceae bacterium]